MGFGGYCLFAHLLTILYTGRECDKLVVSNASPHTTESAAGTWMNVRCHPGYYLPDTSSYRTMICQTNGCWHTDISDCTGGFQIV